MKLKGLLSREDMIKTVIDESHFQVEYDKQKQVASLLESIMQNGEDAGCGKTDGGEQYMMTKFYISSVDRAYLPESWGSITEYMDDNGDIIGYTID